jgi:hypothetical protein
VKRVLLSCLPMLLVACAPPPEPPPELPKPNVIGDPLQQSLDKAQSVEGLNLQHKADVDKAVDEAN